MKIQTVIDVLEKAMLHGATDVEFHTGHGPFVVYDISPVLPISNPLNFMFDGNALIALPLECVREN